ncbi:hypothetical protein BGX21_007423 [Mortierella sp. AD011]|nr:hypothetical protein BGX21_007423 [Mortierella sp. AD011]
MLSVIQPSSSLCLQPSKTTTSLSPNSSSSSSSSLSAANLAKRIPQPYGRIPPRKKRTSAARPSTTPSLSSSNENESLLHSFQSLLLPDSISSYRPSLWANIKAQLPPWVAAYTIKDPENNGVKNRHITACSRDFAPPTALMVSNSSPIVTLDATPLVASSSTDDALLSLPDVDSPLSSQINGLVSGCYSSSFAAMDKLKVVMRTNIIPQKTLEGENKRPSVPLVKRAIPRPSLQVLKSSCRSGNNLPTDPKKKVEEDLPLPRHLASREIRSNPDYLRMMASEMRMIRSRKLISPLKPRGYLPRRKDLFRNVKSSLCVSMEIPCEEDCMDNLMVGSWSSVSSTDTFLSAVSSDYMTADEESFE